MHVINIPQMQQVVRHVCYEQHQAVMFIGGAGVGKTHGIRQAAVDEIGGVLCEFRLGHHDSMDLKGYPEVQDGQMFWRPAHTIPFVGNDNFPNDKPIFFFLDEITSALPAVQAPAYQLIDEYRLGEHKLKSNVYIIAAGNRDSDKGITSRLAMPLCNRMTWFEIATDVDAWCVHAQKMGWAPELIAFMQFRKPLLHTFDAAPTVKVFASPRTWEKAAHYYASKMPVDIKIAAMAGAVGDGPATEFWGFVDVWSKLTPISQIIKDPKGTPVPDEGKSGVRYALAVSIAGHMSVKNIAALHIYLGRMDPEYAILAWHLAVKRDDMLFTTPEFLSFAKQYKVAFS
jgi:hypothetical protein